MGQSLIKNYIHIVFSTKHRKPLIKGPIESELYAYIGGICKELGCAPVQVGGYLDHVHVLVLMSQKIALMTLVQKLKANSSKWIKTKDQESAEFYWQDGYGAFSVNPKQADKVIAYIKNQKSHHQHTSFQEEYKIFLEQYKIDYNEKYVWD